MLGTAFAKSLSCSVLFNGFLAAVVLLTWDTWYGSLQASLWTEKFNLVVKHRCYLHQNGLLKYLCKYCQLFCFNMYKLSYPEWSEAPPYYDQWSTMFHSFIWYTVGLILVAVVAWLLYSLNSHGLVAEKYFGVLSKLYVERVRKAKCGCNRPCHILAIFKTKLWIQSYLYHINL